MNCVNHPEAAVAAYCQNCGKALCTECVRSISGVIYCEQCLAAKVGYGSAGPAGAVPGAIAGPASYQAPYVPPAASAGPADASSSAPPYGPYVPPPMPPDVELQAARREPIGAIVLIGLGMLFLFNTLGLLSFDWIG